MPILCDYLPQSSVQELLVDQLKRSAYLRKIRRHFHFRCVLDFLSRRHAYKEIKNKVNYSVKNICASHSK